MRTFPPSTSSPMIRHAAVWMGFAADVIANGPRVRDEVGVDGRMEPKGRVKWRVRRLSRLSMKRSAGEERQGREVKGEEEEKAALSGDRRGKRSIAPVISGGEGERLLRPHSFQAHHRLSRISSNAQLHFGLRVSRDIIVVEVSFRAGLVVF